MTGIYPVKDDLKVIGSVFTIRVPETDNATLYYTMKKVPKGFVVVIG